MTHQTEPLIDDLLVILVLFNTQLSESAAYISLSKSLGGSCHLFIYDNSPEPQTWASDAFKITYVHDKRNPGVSKAYNEGFKKAKELKKKWLLLVDQDTEFPIGAFKKYSQAISQENTGLVIPILRDARGIVSPLKFSLGGGQRLRHLEANRKIELIDYYFHNSGLLVSVEKFERVGGYDENVPLDFSDFVFVHRLRNHCTHFFVTDITCQHSLASTSNSNAGERLVRFKSYVSSSKHFQKKYQPKNFFIPLRIFLRAIKLTLQYRNFSFLIAYFS